jgi:hypothetical protein
MEERRVEFLPWARAEKLWGKVFPIIAIARNGEEKSLEGYSYAEARKVFPESKFALVKEGRREEKEESIILGRGRELLPHTPRKQSNEVFFVAEEKDKTEGFVKTSGYCLLTPQMQEVFAKLPKEKADKRSVTITEFEDYFSVCFYDGTKLYHRRKKMEKPEFLKWKSEIIRK